MSQRVNGTTHAAYAGRYNVKFPDGQRYVMVRPSWSSPEGQIPRERSEIKDNRYALTGPASFTIVPNTSSCTSDFLRIGLDSLDETWTRHPRSHRKITWLGGDGTFGVELLTNEGEKIVHAADPTVHVNISPFTWYRYYGSGVAVLRSEQLRLVPVPDGKTSADHETTLDPRSTSHSRPAEPANGWAFIPGSAVNLLARKEIAMVTK